MASTLHVIVDRGVPPTTADALRAAGVAGGHRVRVVDARLHRFEDDRPGTTDAVLNTSASSLAAAVEIDLLGDRARSVHRPPRPWFEPIHPHELFARAGVAAVPSMSCPSTARPQLRAVVERLGGFPIVVKVPGGQGGAGVMVAMTWPSLRSLLEHVVAVGPRPRLVSFVHAATHWRVIVVAGRAITSYRNDVLPDDFRSAPAGKGPAPEAVGEIACEAADVLRTDWAGVDVLVGDDGAMVLEVNTPCSLSVPGLLDPGPVAAALVAHLLPRGEVQRPGPSPSDIDSF